MKTRHRFILKISEDIHQAYCMAEQTLYDAPINSLVCLRAATTYLVELIAEQIGNPDVKPLKYLGAKIDRLSPKLNSEHYSRLLKLLERTNQGAHPDSTQNDRRPSSFLSEEEAQKLTRESLRLMYELCSLYLKEYHPTSRQPKEFSLPDESFSGHLYRRAIYDNDSEAQLQVAQIILGKAFLKIEEKRLAKQNGFNRHAVDGKLLENCHFKSLASLQRDLGRSFEWDYENDPDLVDVAYWLQKASGSGNVVATYRLGRAYFDGYGVQQDRERGISLIDRAAEAADTNAMHFRGLLWLGKLGFWQERRNREKQQMEAHFVPYVEPNPEGGLAALHRAAELGNSESLCLLAKLYSVKNDYVEHDEKKAFQYVLEACEDDNPQAINLLASFYWDGIGTWASRSTSIELHRKAAELRNADSMVFFYEHPEAAISHWEALQCLIFAKRQNHPKALFHVAERYRRSAIKKYEASSGLPQEEAGKASHLYRQASLLDTDADKWITQAYYDWKGPAKYKEWQDGYESVGMLFELRQMQLGEEHWRRVEQPTMKLENKRETRRSLPPQGRNESCRCDSGKKYKKCCGRKK